MLNIALFISSLNIIAQEYHYDYENEDRCFVLNTALNNYKSHIYTATDSITLLPGFSFEPAEGREKKLVMEIDKMLLLVPSYGSDLSAPSSNFIGDGMPYTIPISTDVTDNGAATINIPIECPQGVNGLQPELSFVYNSQYGDGIMGIGWSIGGMSKISRVPYTYHYSDCTNAVTFTNNDDFSLDGNRLIKGSDGNYYPEIFDNSIISYDISNGFVLRKPNGYIYKYGKTNESRYYISGINEPIEWHLEEIEDPYGNKINYYYHNNINDGSFYPDKIVYGKHEISFKYHGDEDPDYNGRSDTQRKYFSTSSSSGFSRITKLLTNMFFYYDNDESWFQQYKLLYGGYEQELPLTELMAIEKYGSNNNTRAANKYCTSQFVWNNNERILQKDVIADMLFTGKTYSDNGQMWCQSKVLPVKLNHALSCNLTDIVHLLENEVTPYYYMTAYLNQSAHYDFSEEFNYVFNNGYNINTSEVNDFLANVNNIILFSPMDIDGDGFNEILCIDKNNAGKNTIRMISYISTGNRFTLTDNIQVIEDEYNCPYEFYVGDYDGNGCSDLFAINGNNIEIYLSIDGIFNVRKTKSVQFYHDNGEHAIFVGDFNGDGRDQVICLYKTTINNNTYSFASLVSLDHISSDVRCVEIADNEFAKYKFETDGYKKCTHLCTGDFNGDNKQDMLVIMNSSDNRDWYFYLSKGNGKFTEKITSQIEHPNYDLCEEFIPTMADFNDDGFTDLDVLYKVIDTINDPNIPYHSYGVYTYYRYEYLIRVDDTIGRVIRKNIVEDDQEQYIERVRINNTAIWRKNHILSCIGNFRGTSPNERMYVKLDYDNNTNYDIYAKLINVGGFGNISIPVISEIINGLGAKTKFEYVQHSNQGSWTNYLRNEDESDLPNQAIPYTGSLHVVNKLMKETNQDVYRTTRYFFSDPIFHTRGKGLLGFTNASKVEEIQQTGIKKITSKQFVLDSDYYVFYPKNVKQYTLTGPIEYPSFGDISETIFTYESKKLDAYSNLPAKVFYPFQKEVSVKNKYNATYIKTTINHIDSYGNPTQIIHRYGSSEDDMPYYETNSISYVNTTNPKIIIGLVGTISSIHRNFNSNLPITYAEQYQYDDKGFMTYSNKNGIVTTYTRDNYGNITLVSNSIGDVTKTETMSYSSDGRLLLQKNNPLNHTTSYTYINDKALLKSITDPNELVITYNYNFLDRVKSIEYPDGTKEEFVRRWVGTNNINTNSDHPDIPEGNETVYYTWSKKNGQNEITTFYDQHERKIRTVVKDFNENNIYTDFIYYDISGLLWKESLPYYKSKGESPQYIVYEYDIYDRIKTITKPDGSRLTNNYSGNILTTTNYDGQQKTITYLPAGKPQKIKDNEITEIVYEYFGDGNVKSTIVNGIENSRINYTYDANGFLASMNDPSLGIRTYSYNAFGELMSETNADSLTTYYTYDALGRMTRRIDNDGSTSWCYDVQKIGLLDYSYHETSNTDAPVVTENYIYDRFGRTIEHKQSLGTELQELSFLYDYNEWGLQKSVTYPDGYGVSYSYDYNGFTKTIVDMLTNEIIWRADSTDRYGNMTNFVLGDKVSVNNAYNKLSGLTESQNAVVVEEDNTANTIQNMVYQWDVYGNLTNRNNINTGNSESFRYDAYNRLTKTSVNGNDVCSINFDGKGNITYKSDVGNMMYGSGNPYSLVKISEMPDHTLFSENQNVTYTSFDKVSSITQGTKRLDLYYGADRQRVYHNMSHNSLTRNTTKRFFTNLYEEVRRGDDIKKYHYLTSPSGLFAIFVTHNDTSVMSYVLKDHLGSLYATVTNGDVEYYSFDAWGRDRNHNTLQYDNISTTFDRGFCMHEHYRDFGLINMNGRMYDPLVGRMLSPDIVIQNPEYSQSYNRYSYCFNNPLRFTDPSGYVVTIPPEYLLMNLYSTDINKYRKKIKRLGVDPNTISVDYNTDLSQDGLLFKTISWKEIGVDDPEDIHYLDVFEYDFSDAINNEQSYPMGCIAYAFMQHELRFSYGNRNISEDKIMQKFHDSYDSGLFIDKVMDSYFIDNSKAYGGYNYFHLGNFDIKVNNIDALPENIYRFIRTNTAISLEMKHSIYSNHVVNIHKSFRYHKGNQRKYEYDYYMWGRNETHDQIKNNLMKYIVLFPKK